MSGLVQFKGVSYQQCHRWEIFCTPILVSPTLWFWIEFKILGYFAGAVSESQPEGRMISGVLVFLLVVVQDENGALGDIGRTSLDKPVSPAYNWEWPRSFLWSYEKLIINFLEK